MTSLSFDSVTFVDKNEHKTYAITNKLKRHSSIKKVGTIY